MYLSRHFEYFMFATSLSTLIILACTRNSESDTMIVSGTATTRFPETKLLLTDSVDIGICTGVAVSDNTLIIAAHCIKDASFVYKIKAPQTDLEVEKIVAYNRLFSRKQLSKQDAAYDLAVLIFPDGAFPAASGHAKLGEKSSLEEGTDITIVGYGATELSSQANRGSDGTIGQKYEGRNIISQVKNGTIAIDAGVIPDENGEVKLGHAIAGSGDSGSPMFLEKTDELVGLAVGIAGYTFEDETTGFYENDDGNLRVKMTDVIYVRNLYVDLTSESSQKLFRLAVSQGARIQGISEADSDELNMDELFYMANTEDDDRGEFLAIAGAVTANSTAIATPDNPDAYASSRATPSGGQVSATPGSSASASWPGGTVAARSETKGYEMQTVKTQTTTPASQSPAPQTKTPAPQAQPPAPQAQPGTTIVTPSPINSDAQSAYKALFKKAYANDPQKAQAEVTNCEKNAFRAGCDPGKAWRECGSRCNAEGDLVRTHTDMARGAAKTIIGECTSTQCQESEHTKKISAQVAERQKSATNPISATPFEAKSPGNGSYDKNLTRYNGEIGCFWHCKDTKRTSSYKMEWSSESSTSGSCVCGG